MPNRGHHLQIHSPEVYATCERLMRGGSHSFFAASRLLPARYRCAATAIYAFCRVADDAVDEMPPGASIDVVMAYLHERLMQSIGMSLLVLMPISRLRRLPMPMASQ